MLLGKLVVIVTRSCNIILLSLTVVRYKTITVAPVTSRSYVNHTIPPEVLLRRYFKRDSEMLSCSIFVQCYNCILCRFFGVNYVFSISTECGEFVIYVCNMLIC